MAGKKAKSTYWLFNTDETEPEGKGAHQRMIDQSCIAAWGDCIRHGGAKRTLEQIEFGNTVFLFRAGHGIVAVADVLDGPPIPSKTIFPGGDREFKRPICNLRKSSKPLSCAAIRDATGYDLPGRHIVCRIHNVSAVKHILQYFNAAKQPSRRKGRK
ncbi:MAG: hypothetical protein R3C59_16860 [Planctomycetaceae bacterium]